MKLLVIRHAIAEDRDKFAEEGQSDDQRPLTESGERKMKKAAKGLHSVVDGIDHLATSPLTRAGQTADIVSSEFDIGGAEVIPSLVPEAKPEDFAAWLASQTGKDVIAIVGHEPHLSSLVTWFLTGAPGSRIELKKGGACLVEFDSTPTAGSGTLLWLMTPRQLRRLG